MFRAKKITGLPRGASAEWGFSLMELIVYIGVIALVSTSLVLFSIALSNSRQKALAASEVEANAKIILNYLSRTIRSARSLDEANCLFNDNQGRLALWLGPNNTNGVVFSLDGSAHPQVIVGANPAAGLSSGAVWLSRFKFTKLSDKQLAIDLEVRAGQPGVTPTPENFYQSTAQTVVTLRK